MIIGLGFTMSICGLGFIIVGIKSLYHGIVCTIRLVKSNWVDKTERYYAKAFIGIVILIISFGIYVLLSGIQFYIVQ